MPFTLRVTYNKTLLKRPLLVENITQPTKLRWAEMSWVLPQPPSSHPALHFLWEKAVWFKGPDGLTGRWDSSSYWAPLFPISHGEGRNLLRPRDCFWYVSNSLLRIFPCSNYYVNRVIIHIGWPLLSSKPQVTQHTAFPVASENNLLPAI